MTGTDRFALSAQRRALLENLLRAEGIDRAPARTVAPRDDRDAPVPLTFPQHRLWFLEQFAAHDSAYVISAAMRVRGPFAPDVFARACDEVVRRHESLRTVFFDSGGRSYQQVRPDLRADVRVEDRLGVPPAEVVAEVQRREAELIGEPFDLTTGPLFRVRLLRFAEDDTVVLLNIHHIVSDRWSMGVLMRELTGCYRALATGRAVDLAPLPVQYPDFALWQQLPESQATWASDLDYWRGQLRDAPTELTLITDRHRPREKSYHGASVPVELSPDLVAGLRELARSEGATVFMVLTAAYAALLARLGGDREVVVGTPVANRTLVEVEPLIGLFVNTLALRVDVGGNPPFREVLRRARRVCLEAYDHQGIPFERLVEELQPQRSVASTPVFQVMLSYQNVPFPAWHDGPVRIEPVPLPARKAEFDLLLDLFEDGDRVWGRLEYSADLFEEDTVRQLAGLLRRLLRGAAAGPDRPIGDLPLLGTDEQRSQPAVGTGPQRHWPDGWIHEQVERQARRTPDAEAVRSGRQSLTYAELNARANGLARRLRTAGVGPGVLVGVRLPRSEMLPVALLAVLKAGGCYTAPAGDGTRPGDRPAVLLTDTSPADAPAGGVEVLCLGQPADEPAAGPDADPGVPVDGADVAYRSAPAVGGAVAHTHAGLRNRLGWLQDVYRLVPGDRVLHQTPPAFDASVTELFWPLICGATVVLARPDGHRDPRYLAELIRAGRITAVHLAAPALPGLLRQRGLQRCADLRLVLCSGATLPAGVVQQFSARSRAQLHLLYRPTGAAVEAAAGRCAPEGTGVAPIANTGLSVVDRFGARLPAGVPGELVVTGVPELAGGDGYRTGDLGRLRADGTFEILGRWDAQVKVRGFRVDPGVVASVLSGHPQVDDAVVVAAGAGSDTRLVAYLTGAPMPGARELTGFLRQRLPEYMVPAAFVSLPEVPRTAIGTADPAALPQVQVGRSAAPTPYAAPGDDRERRIAEIWQDLLGVDRVGVHDDFFALGGHSLLATKLAARLREAYRVDLPLREVFDNPTVAALAARIAERGAVTDAPAAAVPRADRSRDLPLAFAQEHLYRHHPLGPEDPIHNVVTAVRLSGPLDVAALRAALDDVVARHEPLRTRIVSGPAGPVQRVGAGGCWPMDTVDLAAAGVAAADVSGRLRDLVEQHGRRPFRLATEPMVRGTLVRIAGDDAVLILVMHHLVTDNWSYGVLIRDLAECYTARVTGRAPRLPDLGTGYADVAAWQQQQLAGGGLDRQLRFWSRVLADRPAPLTLHAAGAAEATGVTRAFVVDPARTRALHDLARQEGATLFMVLLSAFDVLLSAFSGGDDIAVGFPEAGRDRPETAELIGYFVNALVVRADLSGRPTFRELVAQVRQHTLEAYAHRGAPLWAVDGWRPGAHDPTRILFNLLNADVPELSLPGLTVQSLEIGGDYVFSEVLADLKPAEVDLALIMREDGPQLRGTWLYSTDAFDARALGAMFDRWDHLIAEVAADPGADVAGLRARLRRTGEVAG